MNAEQYMQAALQAERFPLGPVLVVILVSTLCVASLLVLAWFLFKTKLPRLRDRAPVDVRGERDREG